MNSADRRLHILIASYLEPEEVDRIRRFDPERYEVHYDPDLLARPLYPSDHGDAPISLDADQAKRWTSMLERADILFDFDPVDPARLPERAPHLVWVQATSTGVGEFLAETGLDRSRLAVTTASGVQARPLAEFAMMGLLHFFRGVPRLQTWKDERHWERHSVRGLDGARALVVGLGSIGSEVARRLADAGVEVYGLRRRSDIAAPPGVARTIEPSELRSTLSNCDALVLCCPLTPASRLVIGKAEIDSFKPGMVLVNLARGALIDEAEMIAALRDGRIAGAALDAYTEEPLPDSSPLWNVPNAILSPHSASISTLENRRIVDIFLDNLGRFRDGRPLRNLFDANQGY